MSFLSQTNRKALDTDLHDAVLRGRRLMRNLLMLGLAGGGTWVVIESAKAISMF